MSCPATCVTNDMADLRHVTGEALRIDPSKTSWLRSEPLFQVFAAFGSANREIRVIGGAVRNHLLNSPVVDVDLATPATPDEVIAIASRAGIATVPTGIEHGTITAVLAGMTFEITTLRRDIETDGRHAIVAFTTDWAKDAQRRDFTINALSCDAEGKIYDYTGGLSDLAARRVRFIGEPRDRIREDYLRILRFFRFTAQYGEALIDDGGLEAATAERDGLKRLSAERVRSEMLKILVAPRAAEILRVMAERGILQSIIGPEPDLKSFEASVAIDAVHGLEPDAMLRLALLIGSRVPAPAMAERLRLSSREKQQLTEAQHPLPLLTPTHNELEDKAALFELGREAYCRSVLAAWAWSGAVPTDQAWSGRLQLPDRWKPPVFPARGSDLIERGITEGPDVGRLLEDFRVWWIAENFPDDPSRIIKKLDELAGLSR